MKRFIVLGSGGREHAIAKKIKLEGNYVVCIPGNLGISQLDNIECIDIKINNANILQSKHELLQFVIKFRPDVIVIGNESYLYYGFSDFLRINGYLVVGSSFEASKLETSKLFGKEIITQSSIRTAEYYKFTNQMPAEFTTSILRNFKLPYVIKDDTLASGKGVTITDSLTVALNHIKKCKVSVVEQFIDGFELSAFFMIDNQSILPMICVHDYKHLKADTFINTGGMGAYCQYNIYRDILLRAQDEIVKPIIKTMREKNIIFNGILYLGLMIDKKDDIYVLEFNTRFGDPEAQVILPLLNSSFSDILYSLSTNTLNRYNNLEWKEQFATNVVLSDKGYPLSVLNFNNSLDMKNINIPDNVYIYSSNLDYKNNRYYGLGGRILSVTALGDSLYNSSQNAYCTIRNIKGYEKYYIRDDIGRYLYTNNYE